jgi:hypothetical protein
MDNKQVEALMKKLSSLGDRFDKKGEHNKAQLIDNVLTSMASGDEEDEGGDGDEWDILESELKSMKGRPSLVEREPSDMELAEIQEKEIKEEELGAIPDDSELTDEEIMAILEGIDEAITEAKDNLSTTSSDEEMSKLIKYLTGLEDRFAQLSSILESRAEYVFNPESYADRMRESGTDPSRLQGHNDFIAEANVVLRNAIKFADALDSKRLYKEADRVENMVKKIAQTMDGGKLPRYLPHDDEVRGETPEIEEFGDSLMDMELDEHGEIVEEPTDDELGEMGKEPISKKYELVKFIEEIAEEKFSTLEQVVSIAQELLFEYDKDLGVYDMPKEVPKEEKPFLMGDVLPFKKKV